MAGSVKRAGGDGGALEGGCGEEAGGCSAWSECAEDGERAATWDSCAAWLPGRSEAGSVGVSARGRGAGTASMVSRRERRLRRARVREVALTCERQGGGNADDRRAQERASRFGLAEASEDARSMVVVGTRHDVFTVEGAMSPSSTVALCMEQNYKQINIQWSGNVIIDVGECGRGGRLMAVGGGIISAICMRRCRSRYRWNPARCRVAMARDQRDVERQMRRRAL